MWSMVVYQVMRSCQDGDPVKVGLPMTDLSTALYAHGAVMAALLSRHKTGRGQKLQCNLFQTQVGFFFFFFFC